MKNALAVLGATLVLALLSACNSEPAEPEQPPEPPPPTADEIAGDFKNVMRPFQGYMQKGAVVPDQQAADALNKIRDLNQKNLTSVNGDEGRRLAGDSIEQMLRQSYDAEAWSMVLFTYQCLDIVDPTAAQSFDRQRRWATIQVNRPMVSIGGVWRDETIGQTTMFLDVTLPATGATERWEAQQGECWSATVANQEYEICLDEIIGTKKAIFTYTQTGEQFEVSSR